MSKQFLMFCAICAILCGCEANNIDEKYSVENKAYNIEQQDIPEGCYVQFYFYEQGIASFSRMEYLHSNDSSLIETIYNGATYYQNGRDVSIHHQALKAPLQLTSYKDFIVCNDIIYYFFANLPLN